MQCKVLYNSFKLLFLYLDDFGVLVLAVDGGDEHGRGGVLDPRPEAQLPVRVHPEGVGLAGPGDGHRVRPATGDEGDLKTGDGTVSRFGFFRKKGSLEASFIRLPELIKIVRVEQIHMG